MKIATSVLIGATVLSASTAFAQENLTGLLTMIDRVDHNVAIQRTQNGTVGTSGSATDVLKVPSNMSLDNVHVGDKVTYSATGAAGSKTITKLEKQ
jgi:hypothetical protein